MGRSYTLLLYHSATEFYTHNMMCCALNSRETFPAWSTCSCKDFLVSTWLLFNSCKLPWRGLIFSVNLEQDENWTKHLKCHHLIVPYLPLESACLLQLLFCVFLRNLFNIILTCMKVTSRHRDDGTKNHLDFSNLPVSSVFKLLWRRWISDIQGLEIQLVQLWSCWIQLQ